MHLIQNFKLWWTLNDNYFKANKKKQRFVFQSYVFGHALLCTCYFAFPLTCLWVCLPLSIPFLYSMVCIVIVIKVKKRIFASSKYGKKIQGYLWGGCRAVSSIREEKSARWNNLTDSTKLEPDRQTNGIILLDVRNLHKKIRLLSETTAEKFTFT